jgi:hypothetical protein
MLGVVNVAAVPADTVGAVLAYQITVPTGLVGKVAVNTTVPVPHLALLDAAGADGIALITTATALDAADKHPFANTLCAAQYVVVELIADGNT